MKKSLFFLLLLICLVGCQRTESDNEVKKETPSKIPTDKPKDVVQMMQVTSESRNEKGQWLTKINAKMASPKGENCSPQLTFDAVEGATCYAIYMIDTSAGNWIHWIAKGVTKTSLVEGEKLPNAKYHGPYPPGGKHTYKINVYALKKEPEKYPGFFDTTNGAEAELEKALDMVEPSGGNIIGKGSIAGTVTHGEEVK